MARNDGGGGLYLTVVFARMSWQATDAAIQNEDGRRGLPRCGSPVCAGRQRRFTLCSSSRGVEWQRSDVAIHVCTTVTNGVDCFLPHASLAAKGGLACLPCLRMQGRQAMTVGDVFNNGMDRFITLFFKTRW